MELLYNEMIKYNKGDETFKEIIESDQKRKYGIYIEDKQYNTSNSLISLLLEYNDLNNKKYKIKKNF
jgi:hypothetical protein